MNNRKDLLSSRIKRLQQRNLLLIVVLVLLVCYWIYSSITPNRSAFQNRKKIIQTELVDPANHLNAKALWFERAQKILSDNVNKTNAIEQKVEKIRNEKKYISSPDNSQTLLFKDLKITVDSLSKEMSVLRNQLHDKKEERHFISSAVTQPDVHSAWRPQARKHVVDDGIKITVLRPKSMGQSSENYVPAGSFVQAIILGGVDASASTMSQKNPTPVLLRITSAGSLPNQKHSHLNGCMITAAAIGDISAERVYIRLERLSCVRSKGDIVDVPVEGTVFGPAGKNGIRGQPLWREEQFTERAFIAGSLAGISNALGEYYGNHFILPVRANAQESAGNLLQYSSAKGFGKALDRLAEYHIKRAEQYHPVIQLSAGMTVDVVFLKGFEFGHIKGSSHVKTDFNNKPYNNALRLQSFTEQI